MKSKGENFEQNLLFFIFCRPKNEYELVFNRLNP